MQELISTLRVGNIFCLIHVGNMTKEKCMRSTRLFAEEVMPRLQNMWPEYEDDDRFWIHPINQAPRSGVAAIGED